MRMSSWEMYESKQGVVPGVRFLSRIAVPSLYNNDFIREKVRELKTEAVIFQSTKCSGNILLTLFP